jgi:hypothetical protein
VEYAEEDAPPATAVSPPATAATAATENAEEDALRLQAAAGAPSVAASRRGQTPQLQQLQQLQVERPLLQAAGASVQQGRKESAVAGVVKEVVRVEVCVCVCERERERERAC